MSKQVFQCVNLHRQLVVFLKLLLLHLLTLLTQIHILVFEVNEGVLPVKCAWVSLYKQEAIVGKDLQVINAFKKHLMNRQIDSCPVFEALLIVHGHLILDAVYVFNVLVIDEVH